MRTFDIFNIAKYYYFTIIFIFYFFCCQIDIIFFDNFNFKLLAQSDEKKGNTKLDLSAKYGYENIADLSAIFDSDTLYFKLNDTMTKYYKMALDSEESVIPVDATNLGALGDYDVTKIIDYAADAIDSAISSSDFKKSKEELTINKKEVKATKYTASLTEKKLKKILDSFLKDVSNDKDLVKIIAETQSMTEAEVKSEIKDFIDMDVENGSEELFKYSVYMTSTGDTLGYSITYDGSEYLIAFKDDVVSIQAVVDGVAVALEFVQESDDHFVISLNSMGMEIATIDIKSKLETVSKGKEYNKVIDIVGSAPLMTDKKVSAKITLNVKKISSVDTTGISDAIDLENMSDTEESLFMSQVERSSLYKFIEAYTGSGSSLVDYDDYDFDF